MRNRHMRRIKYKFVRTRDWFKHMFYCTDDIKLNSVLWAGGEPCAVACDKCGFSMYGMMRK